MDEGTRAAQKQTFVPVRVDANTVIRIEATPLSDSALNQDDEYVKTVSLPSFEEVTNHLKGVAKAIIGVWEEVKPGKATVEFGMEIGIEAGTVTALLVQGSGHANFKVTLEWDRSPTEHTATTP